MKLYSFYFSGIAKPLQVQAASKQQARLKLQQLSSGGFLPKQYHNIALVGETVTTLVFGVNERILNGVRLVYVGEDNAKGGWINFEEFEKKFCK